MPLEKHRIFVVVVEGDGLVGVPGMHFSVLDRGSGFDLGLPAAVECVVNPVDDSFDREVGW